MTKVLINGEMEDVMVMVEEIEGNAKERHKKEAFLLEFADLLRKYGAEIEASDEWTGYPECGEDIHIRVWLDQCCDSIDLGERFSVAKDV